MVKVLLLSLSLFLFAGCATWDVIKNNPDHPITYAAISATTKATLYTQIRHMDMEELGRVNAYITGLGMVLQDPIDWSAGYVYINTSVELGYRDLFILMLSIVEIETQAAQVEFPTGVFPTKRVQAMVAGAQQAVAIRIMELQTQAGLTH